MSHLDTLSNREIEVLKLVAIGKSNKDIALELFISPNTVKVHIRNILSKLEVASRTEATYLAMQNGLLDEEDEADEEEHLPKEGAGEPEIQSPEIHIAPATTTIAYLKDLPIPILLIFLVVLVGSVVAIGQAILPAATPTLAPSTPPAADAVSRWEQLADMPTARQGLGAAVYQSQIYAIGGENTSGVLDSIERFDPQTNTWAILPPKPTAVTDIGAVVLGEKIYVPGGRLGSGDVTNSLEIFDPRTNTWARGAALPASVSAYAIAAFEGKLYIFGGWNGKAYVDAVYAYNPDTDSWESRTPMPTARGFAGAAVSSGGIYVLGGRDQTGALTTNEVYTPTRDNPNDAPWEDAFPLPLARYAMGVTSLSDRIYLIGGEGDVTDENVHMEYLPTKNEWRFQATPTTTNWSQFGMVALETKLYTIGGLIAGKESEQNIAYIALYIIVIPIIE